MVYYKALIHERNVSHAFHRTLIRSGANSFTFLLIFSHLWNSSLIGFTKRPNPIQFEAFVEYFYFCVLNCIHHPGHDCQVYLATVCFCFRSRELFCQSESSTRIVLSVTLRETEYCSLIDISIRSRFQQEVTLFTKKSRIFSILFCSSSFSFPSAYGLRSRQI